MNSPSSLFPFFELLIIVQIKLEKVYIIFHANLTIMRVSTINIVDQSGLNDATSFRLMNGYLGTNYEIPAKNSRYSRNLRWSDTHIRLHGSNELLVSSRSNQKFLKSTAHSSENSKLKHVDHALLTIKTQKLLGSRHQQIDGTITSIAKIYQFEVKHDLGKDSFKDIVDNSMCDSKQPFLTIVLVQAPLKMKFPVFQKIELYMSYFSLRISLPFIQEFKNFFPTSEAIEILDLEQESEIEDFESEDENEELEFNENSDEEVHNLWVCACQRVRNCQFGKSIWLSK